MATPSRVDKLSTLLWVAAYVVVQAWWQPGWLAGIGQRQGGVPKA